MKARRVSVQSCMLLLYYPLSWFVLGFVVLTHLAFAWWFQPTPAMQRLTLGLDACALALWGRLVWRSEAFRQLSNRVWYEASTRQARRIVAACPAAFATPAGQCLDLVTQIYQEFAETGSRRELDTLIDNIAQLAQAHRTLHVRTQRFGTPEQKAHMAGLLQKHIVSVDATLQTLQAFSGNLTLLSASTAADERATQELHFINQGLHDVLQEFSDA